LVLLEGSQLILNECVPLHRSGVVRRAASGISMV
jgi:hypothetical protein